MTPSGTPADLPSELRLALSRRRFLRGVGVCMALPALESLVPPRALADIARASGSLAATPTGVPIRMAFVYFPNGANQPCWWPKGEGKEFDLNRTMKPLEALKTKIQVLGGLDNLSANAGKDGGGDHARASSTFLTAVRIKKTSGADIRAGVSIDQLAAQRIGHLTRVPVPRADMRRCPQIGLVRHRVFVCVRLEHVLAHTQYADGPRAQPPDGLRATFRQRLARRAEEELRATASEAKVDPGRGHGRCPGPPWPARRS